ncbi:hypothetical protein [Microbacterium sp. Leaf436]|uniref:hypothetical protein n=1 Tax=Microbacterium sp. Leaf436 TaxID=1736377 RepID=UPI0006FF2D4A|nr:hypothetical protein [Microbacterium sp. Leaf436]KQT75412.1 hypothetical protein ASG45_02615 [Microbacterium sp. Leaf436]
MDALSLLANPTLRDIGAGAILVLVVLMIITGRLIPKATHDREMKTAITRGDEWKQTAEETVKVNAEVLSQNSQLIKANEVVEAFLRSAGPSPADTSPVGGP